MITLTLAENAVSDLQKFNIYAPKTVGRGPDKVGLYAWYSTSVIGKPDKEARAAPHGEGYPGAARYSWGMECSGR